MRSVNFVANGHTVRLATARALAAGPGRRLKPIRPEPNTLWLATAPPDVTMTRPAIRSTAAVQPPRPPTPTDR
jgi:hypothetical protein